MRLYETLLEQFLDIVDIIWGAFGTLPRNF